MRPPHLYDQTALFTIFTRKPFDVDQPGVGEPETPFEGVTITRDKWRTPRAMYDVSAQGAGSPPELPFYDRGTYEQIVELR